MNKLKKIFRLFWSENFREENIFSNESEARFDIKLDHLLIGTLIYNREKWSFSYSEEFKLQNQISPLTNFPVKERLYESKDLWPFFALRIPSNAQLQLGRNQQKDDIIKLLSKYGRRTITNPYELCLV